MSAKPTSPPPAYFLSLSLENVRSFGEKQTISFAREDGGPAPWTVILGDNGVGKTTVLKSLASLIPFDAGDRYKGGLGIMFASKWRFIWSPIRRAGEKPAEISSEIQAVADNLEALIGKKINATRFKIQVAVPARKVHLDVDSVGWTPIPPRLSRLYGQLSKPEDCGDKMQHS